MNKQFPFLVVLAFFLFSCSQHPQPEIEFGLSQSQIEASTEGGEYPLTVTCATSWSATIDSGDDWVALSATEGNGSADITITTRPGKDYAIAYLTFTTGEESIMLTVVRRAAGSTGDGSIQLSQTTLEVPSVGGQFEVEVTSGVKWMVDKDVSWLTVTPGMGSKNGKLTIDVAVTDRLQTTTGKITVYEVGKGKQSGVVLQVERAGITVAEFSVSDSKKVIFAPGNLQYNRSQDIFRFAEHQYDYIGKANENIEYSWNSGWIDLFGWGTSGYNDKYPYTCSEEYVDYYYETDIADTDYDWGQYNSISDDFYKDAGKGFWRTPTKDEIEYLVDHKSQSGLAGGIKITDLSSGYDFAGLVILPDGVTLPDDLTLKPNFVADYTLQQFHRIQAIGAVFIPMKSGSRSGAKFSNAGEGYWTATHQSDDEPKAYSFNPSFGKIFEHTVPTGLSVRLVHDTE